MERLKDDKYSFEVTPVHQRYYNNDFGIFEFYTTDADVPDLTKFVKEPDFWSDDKNAKKEVVYKGIMIGPCQQLDMNIPYTLTAKKEWSDKYQSHQYRIVNIVPHKPKSISDQKKYLYTILTEKQTNVLVDAYPDIVNMVMENVEFEPDYDKLPGIGQKTFVGKIRPKILGTFVISDLLIMLQPLGVTMNQIQRMLDGQPNCYLLKQELLNNPYILTRIHGMGFKTVDKFAIKIRPELIDSKHRAAACIRYVLGEIADSEGHSWIEISHLRNFVRDLVPECKDAYREILLECRANCEEGKPSFLYVDDMRVGLYKYYQYEKTVAETLWQMQKADNLYVDVDIDAAIKQTNEKNGFDLTTEQEAAVRSVVENNVTIVTGSAGTGKTSVVSAIVNAYKHYDIALTALSAKAARRMTEVTGYKATTIHRLLEASPGKADGSMFKRNKSCKLQQRLIIVDEASMINSQLFSSLLEATKIESKIVIVFDFAQLSPIGVGNIATDLLTSGLPIYKFSKIHRQAEKSGILVDANMVRVGESPIEVFDDHIISGELQDMIYHFREQNTSNGTYEQLHDLTLKTFSEYLEKGVDVDDLSVIVPRRVDVINSVDCLNRKMQDIVLPGKVVSVMSGNKEYKLGAKIIQKKNNYDSDVMNGEIGYIVEIKIDKDKYRAVSKELKEKFDKDREIAKECGVFEDYNCIIDFGDGKFIKYNLKALSEIDLAYAITVHSSQGSQYKYVIVTIDLSHTVLLDTCLFYTAITRASKECHCIAQPKAFIRALSVSKAEERQTFLPELLATSESIDYIIDWNDNKSDWDFYIPPLRMDAIKESRSKERVPNKPEPIVHFDDGMGFYEFLGTLDKVA